MCKAPRPGVSKTRLAAVVGAARAAQLARAFLLDSADILRFLAPRYAATLTAFHTPADAEQEIAALLPGWALTPQPGGDLGARMGAAFDALFQPGIGCALLTGTDAPTLPPALLELLPAAVAAGADAALIPALDGGYCAIAMARPLPALLDGMPWSAPGLLDATRARAAAEGLRLDVLQPWHDVDGAEDLDLLRLSLAAAQPPGCSPLPPYRANHSRVALEAA
ncbi:TIGR04282 family arsenosugar biosynthesis glycosyltransferase [Roseococcus suduntuyensis]|nr:TIGR04282 family arsenosugar biosynthesis glycosyltransferase [Roseococcus suduntuyensis]